MSALDNQVGGSHYMSDYQPIQYASDCKYNAIQLNVLKYATRHKKKNGLEDLKKAIQYCELADVCPFPDTSEWDGDRATRYVHANEMKEPIGLYFLWQLDSCNWEVVKRCLLKLIVEEYGEKQKSEL